MKKICNRCGACCHYWLGTRYKRCSHLVDIKPGVTECAIYFDRLGKAIDMDGDMVIQCIERNKDNRIFPGCPYNGRIKVLRQKKDQVEL